MQDLPVEVEEGALPGQFLQPGVGGSIEGVELVEGFDQERAAAARRVENAEALERFLPCFPEADEGLALGFVEGGQVVGVGVGERLAGGAGGFRLVLLPQCLEALFQHAAQRLADEVTDAVERVPTIVDGRFVGRVPARAGEGDSAGAPGCDEPGKATTRRKQKAESRKQK